MSLTRQFVEQRIQRNRQAESKNAELRKMLVTHNILAGHGRSESHVEDLRQKRVEAAERKDLFMDYTYVKAAQDQAGRQLVAEAEERMADELARRNAETERLDQEKRRICEGSEELRVLKERLHQAKVNKERAQQLLEIEMRREKQRRMDHKVAEHMENERLECLEVEYKVEIEKSKHRTRVKNINQMQIQQKEEERIKAMEEYQKEKAQVQGIVDRVQAEDDAELAAKEQKRRESKEMLLRFKIEQAERQEAQEQAEIEENDRIAKFAADKAEREERLARERLDAEKEKERILLTIIKAQEAKNAQAEELENLRNDLHQEEHEHRSRAREAAKKQKNDEDREEMKKAYVMQMNMQAQKKAEAKDEEDKIRDTLLSKFAEDERIEQMNANKRRMRIEAHKREAQRLIDLRRSTFENVRADEQAELQRQRDEEANRQRVIEAERMKLLREAAVPLRDFLPKGTLQRRDEYTMIFPDYASTYSQKRGKGNLTART